MHPTGTEGNLLLCLDGNGGGAICRTSCLNLYCLSMLFRVEKNFVGPVSGDKFEVPPVSYRIIVTAASI